jgi:hypothetical protein
MARTPEQKEATREFRYQLVMDVGRCEWCGCRKVDYLCCHEILRGPLRQLALDKPWAILVVCPDCHPKMDTIPKAGQLARLYLSRSTDYNLVEFNKLAISRVAQEDVDQHIDAVLAAGRRGR